MPELPDTRASLLVRVSDPGDDEAWREFTAIYRPAVYRLGRRRGLQDADADDLAQRVLLAVSQKIADWRPTSPKASFRGWLAAVTGNAIVNALTRVGVAPGKGGTSVVERLAKQPGRDESLPEFDEEFRRALFRRASEEIRQEFHESTWQAFWMTAVEGLAVEAAAERLKKSAGVIYASRSRVMRRLREKVEELNV